VYTSVAHPTEQYWAYAGNGLGVLDAQTPVPVPSLDLNVAPSPTRPPIAVPAAGTWWKRGEVASRKEIHGTLSLQQDCSVPWLRLSEHFCTEYRCLHYPTAPQYGGYVPVQIVMERMYAPRGRGLTCAGGAGVRQKSGVYGGTGVRVNLERRTDISIMHREGSLCVAAQGRVPRQRRPAEAPGNGRWSYIYWGSGLVKKMVPTPGPELNARQAWMGSPSRCRAPL